MAKNPPLYYSWWTSPINQKVFRKGIEQFLTDDGFKKSFFGHTLSKGDVRIEVSNKEVKGRKKTDIRVYAAGSASEDPIERSQEETGRFGKLEILRGAIDGQINDQGAYVDREFYGDYWEKLRGIRKA